MQIKEQVCNYWCKAFFDSNTKKIRYISLLKNRPIQNEDYTLYRIKKMYLFSFTVSRLKTLYEVYKKNHRTFVTNGSRWVIDSNSILKWLKEDVPVFQDILFWDDSIYLNDKPFPCLDELNDNDIITVPAVSINDFKKITNETAADRRLKEKKLHKAKNQRLLNELIEKKKVRYIGASAMYAYQLQKLRRRGPGHLRIAGYTRPCPGRRALPKASDKIIQAPLHGPDGDMKMPGRFIQQLLRRQFAKFLSQRQDMEAMAKARRAGGSTHGPQQLLPFYHRPGFCFPGEIAPGHRPSPPFQETDGAAGVFSPCLCRRRKIQGPWPSAFRA